MKAKSGFTLRHISDEAVLVPFGQNVLHFQGIISLNETGKFIWEKLQNEIGMAQLAREVCNEFDVSYDQALQSVSQFVSELQRIGVVNDE